MVCFILVNSSPKPSGIFIDPVDELISDKLELNESYNELISLTLDAALAKFVL